MPRLYRRRRHSDSHICHLRPSGHHWHRCL